MDRTLKRVFLVRHGQSTANESGVHEGTHAVLTQLGTAQAAHVAYELDRRGGVDAIVASGEPRAIQSAKPASGRLGIVPQVFELLNERRRPSETIGLHADDPLAKEIMHLVDAGARFSDEESIRDLLDRGLRILEFLLAHPKQRIAVFSHAHTMRAIHAIITSRMNAAEREYRLAYDTLRMDNGGISIIEYATGHKSELPWWHIRSWNETGHLL